jgi:hypothetical protein
MFDINAQLGGRQVADMADRCGDPVIIAEISADGFRLGR